MISNYYLCNSTNLYSIACSTSLYKDSFIPSVVDEWNLLPQNIRDLESVSSFKDYLNIDKAIPNKLFLTGKRRFQIIHARLRNECSSLKHHLFIRKIVESPLCVCGAGETNRHYLFECLLYRNARNILHRSLSHFSCEVDLNGLLFGSNALTFLDNKEVFLLVHSYIKESKKFD